MYKLMLPEEHDVQVTHLITGRGADVCGCFLASAVFCPWILATLTAMDQSRDYTRLLRIPSKDQ